MQITKFLMAGQNVKIDIDDEFWQEIPYLIASDFHLQKGCTVDENLLSEIDSKVKEKAAFDYCVWYLARYTASEKKMRSKLYERGYKNPVVSNVIAKLIELNLLDDFRFAENLVAKKSSKLGKSRLRVELKSKGISDEITSEVLLGLDEDDLFESALRVAEKWFRSHELDTREDFQKFLRFMAYRGFDYDTIKRCREVLVNGKND